MILLKRFKDRLPTVNDFSHVGQPAVRLDTGELYIATSEDNQGRVTSFKNVSDIEANGR